MIEIKRRREMTRMNDGNACPLLPSWNKGRPVLEYDPDDIYDMTYRSRLMPLLEKLSARSGLTGRHAPEMAFGRLYSDNGDGSYLPLAIIVDEKYMSLKRMIAELKLEYGLSVVSIPIPGAEYGEEYIYVTPGYRWEDADFWMSIRDELDKISEEGSEKWKR